MKTANKDFKSVQFVIMCIVFSVWFYLSAASKVFIFTFINRF
nr:MAG TPA: hypothetical protein [Caudoviricetes sp.]